MPALGATRKRMWRSDTIRNRISWREPALYSHPALDGRHAASFDLLLRGLEITTGGQRLHLRSDSETALCGRGFDPKGFETHLRMFDLGMPPHGGLASGPGTAVAAKYWGSRTCAKPPCTRATSIDSSSRLNEGSAIKLPEN